MLRIIFATILMFHTFSLYAKEAIYEDDMLSGWKVNKSKTVEGRVDLSPAKEQYWHFDLKKGEAKFSSVHLYKKVHVNIPKNFVFKFDILNETLTKGKLKVAMFTKNKSIYFHHLDLGKLTLDWQTVSIKAGQFHKKNFKPDDDMVVERIMMSASSREDRFSARLHLGDLKITPLEIDKTHVGEVSPARIFANQMVLQAKQPIPVWGKAPDGREITVLMNGQEKSATAIKGKWHITLDPMDYGGPHDLIIRSEGSDDILLKNILIGEVWLCSGQSNMAWPVKKTEGGEHAINASENAQIRLFTVDRTSSPVLLQDLHQSGRPWSIASPESVADFSGTAYYYGRELYDQLKVPIGLIFSAWGGTPAEFWTSETGLKSDPSLEYHLRVKPPKNKIERRPMGMFNGMVHPLAPLSFRGVIWYQGESNVCRAEEYRVLFPAMINSWRTLWGKDFPFHFVQLAGFKPGLKGWPVIREAQSLALNLPNTGMACAIDIGDPEDIHPKNKYDVGRRLALIALHQVYGKDIVYSGPRFKTAEMEASKIRLHFSHVGSGLKQVGEELIGFEIAGADGQFMTAEARIEDQTVVVSHADILSPKFVRYGWRSEAFISLFNEEGLPAVPFKSEL